MASTPANSINESTTGIVGFTGTAFTATAATQYNVQVGGSTSSTLASVAPSATSGVPLISQGSSSNPAFGTAIVAGGGTGVTTMTTAYAPVCAGTTATGALQVASTGLSTSGLPLLTNGNAALPSFTALSASNVNGSTSGSAPAAGVIGQQITANASAVSITNNNATNIASINLTAGIWDVTGMGVFIGTVTGTSFRIGINNQSATMPGSDGINQLSAPIAPTAVSDSGLTLCPQRFSLSAGSSTIYLVGFALISAGTLTANGIITATRVG